MTNPYEFWLTLLEKYTDEALDVAKQNMDDFPNDAINWGDLQCVDAEAYLSLRNPSDNSAPQGRVYIEEASPTARDLSDFVRSYLHEQGFPGIEVVVEW